MARTLKKVGIVLGAVALISTGLGAALGGAALLGVAGGTFATVGTIAGVASGIANVASTALAKPPKQQGGLGTAAGSITQVLIAPDAPRPYPMGAIHFGGVLRHREGYGGTIDGVPNPYLLDIVAYSGVGPIQSLTPQVDFAAVPAWYSGYLATDTQLGTMPEATALAASYGTPGGWTTAHKLSGHAAIAWNLKFDKTGKKFASGFPLTGALLEGVKVYDPRLDSTFPGGSGAHRLNDETTWAYSDSPALHAGTYAYGRYASGVRVMGIGLPVEGVDFAAVAAWANVCTANDWTIGGIAFEPGDRWDNLKNICAAGAGEPAFSGAVLSFRYDAPVVALDTVTEADVLDGMGVTFMQSYRDRLNVIVPKYRSADHNWEIVAAEAVIDSALVTLDGEERREEWPFNFVTDKDQVAQLAAYKLRNSREFHPIRFTGMPRLRNYRPGDCLHLDLPRLGLDTPAVLLERRIDPATMTVELTFVGETDAKHAYALGLTGTAPSVPTLGQTAEERDETAAGAGDLQNVAEVVPVRSFAADSTGAVTSGLLPDYIVPKVTRGGVDVRTEDYVTYALATNGVTASVDNTNGSANKGRISVTAVDALQGYVDLTVTITGVTLPTKRIVIQKVVGLPSGFGGPGSKIASDNAFAGISGTGFVAITDVLTVTVATGETLHGIAPLDYQLEATGTTASRSASAKWQHSPTGAGTWTDFDTEITGSLSAELPDGSVSTGHGDFNQTEAGLTAGDYDVRLVAALNNTGRDVVFSGTATIEAKT